jgi:energy-coupling factor transporter transmembrane protein EcfT
MVLVVAVVLGVAVFCFVKGFVVVGVICLLGISKHVGFVALLITSVFLFSKGYWLPGSIPLLLMAWNLVGLFLRHRGDVGSDVSGQLPKHELGLFLRHRGDVGSDRNGNLEGNVEEDPGDGSLGDSQAQGENREASEERKHPHGD